jgi:hypothetical protein
MMKPLAVQEAKKSPSVFAALRRDKFRRLLNNFNLRKSVESVSGIEQKTCRETAG